MASCPPAWPPSLRRVAVSLASCRTTCYALVLAMALCLKQGVKSVSLCPAMPGPCVESVGAARRPASWPAELLPSFWAECISFCLKWRSSSSTTLSPVSFLLRRWAT